MCLVVVPYLQRYSRKNYVSIERLILTKPFLIAYSLFQIKGATRRKGKEMRGKRLTKKERLYKLFIRLGDVKLKRAERVRGIVL